MSLTPLASHPLCLSTRARGASGHEIGHALLNLAFPKPLQNLTAAASSAMRASSSAAFRDAAPAH